MADKEVTFKLNVAGQDKAARDLQGVAAAAEKTAKAFNALAENSKKMEAADRRAATIAAGRSSLAESLANQKLEQMRLAKEVEEYIEIYDPDRAIRGPAKGGSGGPGRKGAVGGVGFGGRSLLNQVAPIFGISALGAAGRAAAGGLDRMARSGGFASGGLMMDSRGGGLGEGNLLGLTSGDAEAAGKLARQMAEAVPVVGGLVSGTRSLINAMDGTTAAIEDVGRFMTASARQSGFAGFSAAQQFGGQQQVAGLRRQAGDLAAEAAGAARFRNLTPAQLAAATAMGVPGLTTDATGGLRLAAGQATVASEVAQGTLGRRRAEAAAAQRNLGGAQEAARQLRAEQAAIISRANAAGPTAAGDELRAQAGALGGRVANATAAEGRAALELQERLKDVQEAGAAAAQKEFERKQALLALEKDRLQVAQTNLDLARQGALQAGVSGPGEQQALLELARAAKANPDAVTAEQRQRLISDPAAGRFFEKQFREKGAQDPAFRARLAEFNDGATPEGLQATRDQIAQGVAKGMLDSAADLAEDLSGAFAEGVKALIPTIGAAVAAAIAAEGTNIQNQIQAEILKERLQQRQQ